MMTISQSPFDLLPDDMESQLAQEITKISGATNIPSTRGTTPEWIEYIKECKRHEVTTPDVSEESLLLGAKEIGEFLLSEQAKSFYVEIQFLLDHACNKWTGEGLLKVKYK